MAGTRPEEATGARWTFLVLGNDPPALLVASLTNGLLPREPLECSTSSPWYGPLSRPIVVAWLSFNAGVPIEQMTGEYTPKLLSHLRTVLSWPLDEQHRWYDANRVAMSSCGTPPTGDIAAVLGIPQ